MSRVDADHGAQVIIYQTSDSTFQASWAPAQHASLSAVRAAETGRPVVQAALTGDSAAFDARGRQLAWAGTSYRGVVLVHLELPPASARTFYDRLGDYVPWLAVAVAAIAAAIALMRRRSGRRRRSALAARPRSSATPGKPRSLAAGSMRPMRSRPVVGHSGRLRSALFLLLSGSDKGHIGMQRRRQRRYTY